MQDRIRAYLDEEGFKERFYGAIVAYVEDHTSPEFFKEYRKLRDRRDEKNNHEDTREFYDCGYQTVGNFVLYDLFSSRFRRIYEFHLKELTETIEPNSKIIDVACGSGIITVGLAELLNDMYIAGVDISDLVIRARERAERRNMKNIEFVRANMDDLRQELLQTSLRSSLPFDHLICMDAISEGINGEANTTYENASYPGLVKRIKSRLDEFKKIVRNSGKISISETCPGPERDSYDNMVTFYEKMLGKLFSLESMRCKEIMTKDCKLYTTYLFNLKVKS